MGLNNKYEGPNQGEAFSFDHKTDINITDQDGFVFASECIYWKGMKNLAATIDLLLERIKWRESKAAIFVFSNNKDIEAIRSRIQKTVKSHKNFKHQLESNNESRFIFKLHIKGDRNKEFYLSINLFSVPF